MKLFFSGSVLALLLSSFSITTPVLAAPPIDKNQSTQNDQTIAIGVSGNLTQQGFEAYMQALEFCLAEVGKPVQFDAASRNQFKQQMIQAYPGLSPLVQQNLSQAPQLWNQYRQSWSNLSITEKKEFAYDVLALVYGEQAASEALGLNKKSSTSKGGGVTSHYSTGGAGGYGSYASDGKCSYFSSGGISMSTCD